MAGSVALERPTPVRHQVNRPLDSPLLAAKATLAESVVPARPLAAQEHCSYLANHSSGQLTFAELEQAVEQLLARQLGPTSSLPASGLLGRSFPV